MHQRDAILDYLWTKAADQTTALRLDTRIIGLWVTSFQCQPEPSERVFRSHMTVAQTGGQGTCLSDEPPLPSTSIVGKDALDFRNQYDPISIAILDSLFAQIPRPLTLDRVIGSEPRAKAIARADIVADETCRFLKIEPKQATVALVGWVANIAVALQALGPRVLASDTQHEIVGTRLNGIEVEGPESTFVHISQADAIVVTGMTLQTRTLGPILEASQDIPVVVFAQTGASLCYEYLNLGATSVVSEPFPIYDFHGDSVIRIGRSPSTLESHPFH